MVEGAVEGMADGCLLKGGQIGRKVIRLVAKGVYALFPRKFLPHLRSFPCATSTAQTPFSSQHKKTRFYYAS